MDARNISSFRQRTRAPPISGSGCTRTSFYLKMACIPWRTQIHGGIASLHVMAVTVWWNWRGNLSLPSTKIMMIVLKTALRNMGLGSGSRTVPRATLMAFGQRLQKRRELEYLRRCSGTLFQEITWLCFALPFWQPFKCTCTFLGWNSLKLLKCIISCDWTVAI